MSECQVDRARNGRREVRHPVVEEAVVRVVEGIEDCRQLSAQKPCSWRDVCGQVGGRDRPILLDAVVESELDVGDVVE